MIEQDIQTYLIAQLASLDSSNCLLGAIPSTPDNVTVISGTASPLTDAEQTISGKVSIPKGINDVKVTVSITVRNTYYANGSALIWGIFNELGGENGGFKNCNNKDMFFSHVETPHFSREDSGKNYFNFTTVVTTPSGN